MRRLTVAFLILFSAAVLAACGDTGDHFGEFRQAPPGPVTVQQLQVSMPIIPGPFVTAAKNNLFIVAKNGGQSVPQGTSLANPIIVTTNYVGYVTFSSPTGPAGKQYKSLSLQAAPPQLVVYYTRPRNVVFCRPGIPDVVVTVYNHDANPPFVTTDLTGCSTVSPSPSSSASPTTSPKPTKSPKPTPSASPTPQGNLVKRLALSMPATPNPLSPGTFTLVVTAFNGSGQAIPTGTVLANPIQLTSNSSCSINYSFNGA